MTPITQEEMAAGTNDSTPPKRPPRWFVHGAWRVHRALYNLSRGRFLWTTSNKRGWGALRLTTVGRKSGQEHSVIVGYLEDGPNLVLLAMNGWDEGHPAWWLNLEHTQTPWCDCRTNRPAECTPFWLKAKTVTGSGSAGPRSNRSSTVLPANARPRPR